jgi:hypothetical protein
MSQNYIAIFALLVSQAALGQQPKIRVSVSQTGHDRIGSLFTSAVEKELSHSTKYQQMDPKGTYDGLRFYVQLATVDVADDGQESGKKSAVSVVIESMGFPNSYPVPYMWYHKIFVVDQKTVDRIAKDFLENLDAAWCSTITNSITACPKEKLFPIR